MVPVYSIRLPRKAGCTNRFLGACTSSGQGQDLKISRHSTHIARRRHCTRLSSLHATASYNRTLTDSRLILHSVQQHYSCFVATLHTRHVCALSDATTRDQAKRLCGPASLSYLRSAPSTHRTFLGKAKVFIGWPSLSLRVYIPA
jgi:hypothetical protein